MIREIKNYFVNHGVNVNSDLEQMIEENLQRKSFSRNEIILRPGEFCNYTFFVGKGLLRSFTIDANGKEHILQFAPENWFVSDRSTVLFNDLSEQYIEAVEDSEVILIPVGIFEKLSELSVDFQKFNLFILHNHIRHLQKRINLLLSASAEVRYMDFIKMYPDILFRVPQWMVASYLGITPESLSRVRKELARKNFKPD